MYKFFNSLSSVNSENKNCCLNKVDMRKERLSLIKQLTYEIKNTKFVDQCARVLNYTLIGFFDQLMN